MIYYISIFISVFYGCEGSCGVGEDGKGCGSGVFGVNIFGKCYIFEYFLENYNVN